MEANRIIDISYASKDEIVRDIDKLLQAQADISFKAGYNKALAQLADMTEECKQIGRKEVVEWINDRLKPHPVLHSENPTQIYLGKEWQAKLKEWNVKTE